MTVAYADVRRFVQHLGPTWRKTQHENCARLVHALLERPSLCLSDLARAMSPAAGPLHGRIKRLERFLSNPRLDEPALFVRWLKLTYHFSDGPEPAPGERPILPLLLDTVYFEPYALLVISVPCGSRGLPVAPCTYHRRDLQACLAPKATWPSGDEPFPPRPRRRRNGPGNSGAPSPQIELKTYLSQNEIEAELIERVFILLCPSLRGVIVADRGFARASLFCELRQQERDFVIRIDAQTHIGLPQPLAPDRAKEGTPAQVLNLQPGQRIWCPQAWYSKEERVPISLLAVWDVGQEEPWYIATSLESAEQTEMLYRWRMRLECANRDEKTGVILREGGDDHRLSSVLHLHRLLLGVCLAHWLCALTGLQAQHDLGEEPQPVVPCPSQPARPDPPEPVRPGVSTGAVPCWVGNSALLAEGPSPPPPISPHRGPQPKPAVWMKRFVAWGRLSYVRLGLEVLRSPDLHRVCRHLVLWLAAWLWPNTPLWHPRQVRYRMRHWWNDSS